MSNNVMMIPVSEVFLNVHYEVPIYQRNYAWGSEQIEQLIEDIMSSKDNYYLGNLIVNQKDSNVFEVIDGQQRLTTLFLLQRYLGIKFSSDALEFEARAKSNKTLKALPDDNNLPKELQSMEIKEGYKIICNYFEKNLKVDKDQLIQRLNKVNIIRVQVPAKIDLNHYFEIMNTRGEQLELHEIAKANILSKLKSPEDKKIANDIWEYCSQMDSYVQMNYPKDKRDKIFCRDWSELSDKVSNFDSLKGFYQNEEASTEESFTLDDILQGKIISISESISNKDTENERFESIISFPNFLLQVNRAINPTKIDDESSLDDKNFLSTLENHWENEKSAKTFLFMLLKSRVLFDKFILKREYSHEYKELGRWSLQRLEKYRDNNDKGDKPKYVGTFGNEDNINKKLRTLQSALRITYTSPKTMHWISLVLSSCINDKNVSVLEILEDYAQSKVVESKYEEASGFGYERIVFSYLDYLIYRDGYSYNGNEIVRPLADDWQFQFRNSIEHFYPQNPAEMSPWDDEDLNCFGNLALITVSGNSTFNNSLPIGKARANPGIIAQSLKLKIMAEMMGQNDEWDQNMAYEHQEEMFKILRSGNAKFD